MKRFVAGCAFMAFLLVGFMVLAGTAAEDYGIQEVGVDGVAIAPASIVTTGTIQSGGLLTCSSGSSGCTSLSSDPAPTFSADPDLVTYDLKRGDDWYKTPVATDAAPNPTTFVGQGSVVSAADVVTNQTGANEVHQPGTGLRQLKIMNAAGVATVTLQSQTDGVLNTARTLVIGTICAAGGLTAAQCACLVYDALVATPAAGIATPTRLDGTCSNARLAFAVTPGAASTLTIASTDQAVAATVSGLDGHLQVPAGTEAQPAIQGPYAGYGLRFLSNGWALSRAGGNDLYSVGTGVTSSGALNANTSMRATTSMSIGASGAGNYIINGTTLLKGQVSTIDSAVANCTFAGGGGGATCTTSAFIPLGASVLSVTGRQVTPSTTCTTCTAGANMGPGLDADQYGAALECDVDNTLYTTATATANVVGTCLLAGGCTITMTAVGGNCVSGVAAWTVHYITAAAATAD